MAEVRKVRPGKGGHIAQAIAKAMGETVRPITPGGSPDPSQTSRVKPTEHTVTATSFVFNDAFLLPAPVEEAADTEQTANTEQAANTKQA
jgi:hypothetical protein